MSDIILPRPSQIKNLLAPRDSGDAVNYGLIRQDYPPVTPHLVVDGDVFDLNVIENEARTVTYTYTATVANPLSGDGVSSFVIDRLFFSPHLPSIPHTITPLSASSASVTLNIPALMASVGTGSFRVDWTVSYRANGIDTTETDHGASNRINIRPDWYAGTLSAQPTMVSQLTRVGALAPGSNIRFNPPSGDVVYIFWPTSEVNNIVRRLSSSASSQAYWTPFRIDANGVARGSAGYAGDVVDGDHTLFRLNGVTGAGVPIPLYYRG